MGTARVRVDYVGRAALDGSDDRQLMATLRTGEPAPPPSTVMVASAKPFVPQLSPVRGTVRGDIPLPEGRPYSLGHTSADVASIGATSSLSASRRQQPVSQLAAKDEDRMPAARPVSSYAHPLRAGFAPDTSPRGLY